MARITYSPLIADARGKIGDVVFSAWKGVGYVRQRVTPSNPNTSAQQAVRAALAAVVAGWQDMEAAFQTAFGAGASSLGISGYNDWCKRNATPVHDESGLYGPRRDPDYASGDFVIPTGAAAAAGSASGEIDVTWTDPGGGADDSVAVLVWDVDQSLLVEQVQDAALVSAETYTVTGLQADTDHLVALIAEETAIASMVHAASLTATSAA